jgi:malate synthase
MIKGELHGVPPGSASSLEITGPVTPAYEEILSPQALAFVEALVRDFGARREELMRRRTERQAEIDAGRLPDFLPDTADVRGAEWRIAPVPLDLQDRRVEITGPAGDRKMVINALNSGAHVFMADFEDALSSTWTNVIEGQINLRDAIRRKIDYASPEGKEYRLNERTATLLVRPRGWHLPEKHVLLDGKPVPGGIFDFGLYFFHNVEALLRSGTGPYFYLPKLESHLEARLWNDIFVRAESLLGVPKGTIKATVLIETILAAFEMDEILYELREHSAGLNCGRWDYIFSCIKKFRHLPEFIYPDRAQVTMTTHFMRSYSLLAIKTCHRRGAHAIGGMSAYIPVKGVPEENERALAQVRADKEREASDGHDGTWVAHPGLVGVALEVFDRYMPTPNQLGRLREDVQVGQADLLTVPAGTITEGGLRTNVSVGVQYLAAWLNGSGAVPINNLMEDAATAEICRAQLWQWIRHPMGILQDGRKVTAALFRHVLAEELNNLRASLGNTAYEAGGYDRAAALFEKLTVSDDFVEFLTIPGYALLD